MLIGSCRQSQLQGDGLANANGTNVTRRRFCANAYRVHRLSPAIYHIFMERIFDVGGFGRCAVEPFTVGLVLREEQFVGVGTIQDILAQFPMPGE